MENELEVVNIRLVKEPSLYSDLYIDIICITQNEIVKNRK
jgi:hypothetical protein